MIKAFTAVMSDMTTNLGFRFCWGLPTAMFGLALCWTPCVVPPSLNDALEKDCHLVFQMPEVLVQRRDRRQGFPSWSWTGHRYESAVLYPSEIRSILQSHGSVKSHTT